MSGWDWLGLCLMIPPLLVLALRVHRRWSLSLDRHIESALLQANRPCECGRPGFPRSERWSHNRRCCAPAREMLP